jgi:hypothetical protein
MSRNHPHSSSKFSFTVFSSLGYENFKFNTKNHPLTRITDRQNEKTQHPSHKTGIHNSSSYPFQFLQIIPEINYDNPQWQPDTAMQLTQN